MVYLATASGPLVRNAMAAGLIGQLITPNAGNRLTPGGIVWAIDNGCFSARWDSAKWLATLDKYQGVPRCLFAAIPDVVGNATATNKLWVRWHRTVRNRGYRTAYVGQDGCETIPASAGAFFVGGSTEWKLGPQARRLVAEAKSRGLWAHMGRVNSLRRFQYAADIGCDSVDGTFLAFGPDVNLPRLLRWVDPVVEWWRT